MKDWAESRILRMFLYRSQSRLPSIELKSVKIDASISHRSQSEYTVFSIIFKKNIQIYNSLTPLWNNLLYWALIILKIYELTKKSGLNKPLDMNLFPNYTHITRYICAF